MEDPQKPEEELPVKLLCDSSIQSVGLSISSQGTQKLPGDFGALKIDISVEEPSSIWDFSY